MNLKRHAINFFHTHERGFRVLSRWMIRHPLHRHVERDLQRRLKGRKDDLLMDIGSRRSPYSIGLDCQVLGLDMEAQPEVDLGADRAKVTKRALHGRFFQVIGDGRELPVRDRSLDAVTAIEVIEHVDRDRSFVENLSRSLKSEGFCYLTTPNGVTVPNTNPHHVRHYTPEGLKALLLDYFVAK